VPHDLENQFFLDDFGGKWLDNIVVCPGLDRFDNPGFIGFRGAHDDFNIFGVNIDEVLPFLAGDTNTFKIVFTPATGRVIYNISSMVDTIYLDYQSLMSNTNSPSIKKYFNFLNVSENNKNLTSNFFMVNILDWKIDVINFPKNKNGLSEPNNKPYGNLFFSGKFLISTF